MRRRAFTLLELLVVIVIIVLLIALLVPGLGAARRQAQRVRCQTNLRAIGQAVQLYLHESRDVYPDVRFYACLGYIGRSAAHADYGSQIPESRRPLNRYFGVRDSPSPDIRQVEYVRGSAYECPCDRGDGYARLPGKYFVEHGTSYIYAGDVPRSGVPLYGVASCLALRVTDVRYPAKKIVFFEPVFNPSFTMLRPEARWHHPTRNHGNLLFADGHVEFRLCTIFDMQAQPDENNPYY